jgi:hypothetical protein
LVLDNSRPLASVVTDDAKPDGSGVVVVSVPAEALYEYAYAVTSGVDVPRAHSVTLTGSPEESDTVVIVPPHGAVWTTVSRPPPCV